MTSLALLGCRGDKGTGTDGWKTGPLWPPCSRSDEETEVQQGSRTARCPAGAPSSTPLGGGPPPGCQRQHPSLPDPASCRGLTAGGTDGLEGVATAGQAACDITQGHTGRSSRRCPGIRGGLHPWGCLPLLEDPLCTHHCPRRPPPTLPPTQASALALSPFCHRGPPCGLPCSRPRAQDSLQGGQRSQHPFVHSFIHPTYECSLSIFQCRVLG